MSSHPVFLSRAHIAVEHWLLYPNIVLLDTAVKKVRGRRTNQQAIVVGVIKKKSPAALTALDFPVPAVAEIDVIQPDGSVRRTPVPTDVVETGRVRPFEELWWWERPCPGGFQIKAVTPGIYGSGAGTAGVTTMYRGRRCLLTNCHVMGDYAAGPGLPVYQPERAINRQQQAQIGFCDGTFTVESHSDDFLNRLWPFHRRNTWDFAWCEVPSLDDASHRVHQIYKGQAPLKIGRTPVLDEEVVWIGRTTGEPQVSTIESLEVQGKSTWSGGRAALWRDLLSIDPDGVRFEDGDSGSALIATSDKAILGLMSFGAVAGDETYCLASRIPPEGFRPSWNSPQQLRFRR
ncbi:hypothetical protein ACFVRB_33090 [Streptomyces nojiriensis]|uniref:hypothetical protein n=1 Tax=Streptomyces nojiriensis TaxID=66374 RepID=UPI0036DC41DA